jgi:hypothetical protein
MTIDQVAPLLYGPSWQTPLAEALHLSVRTVQRWARGEREPGPEIWKAMSVLMRERQRDLEATIKKLGAPK